MKHAPTTLAALFTASIPLLASPARAQDAPPAAPPPDLPAVPPAAAAQPVAPAPKAATPAPPSYPQAAPYPQAYPQGAPYPQAYPQGAPYPQPYPYAYPPPYVQPAPRPHVDQPRRETSRWYGWQTLLAIVPFDIAMFTGIAKYGDSGSVPSFVTGFVGRNLAPAVVHLFHKRPGTAFGSVGLHAAATATGVAIGYAIGIAVQEACPPRAPCRNGFRDLPPGPEYGAIAGSMVGTVLDVVLLARRPLASSEVYGVQARPTVTVVPFATASSGGLAAGGTF